MDIDDNLFDSDEACPAPAPGPARKDGGDDVFVRPRPPTKQKQKSRRKKDTASARSSPKPDPKRSRASPSPRPAPGPRPTPSPRPAPSPRASPGPRARAAPTDSDGGYTSGGTPRKRGPKPNRCFANVAASTLNGGDDNENPRLVPLPTHGDDRRAAHRSYCYICKVRSLYPDGQAQAATEHERNRLKFIEQLEERINKHDPYKLDEIVSQVKTVFTDHILPGEEENYGFTQVWSKRSIEYHVTDVLRPHQYTLIRMIKAEMDIIQQARLQAMDPDGRLEKDVVTLVNNSCRVVSELLRQVRSFASTAKR